MSDDALPNDLPKPGDRLLGKFRIERILGQGGAGVVYAAHHELLDQRIALKVLLASGSPEATSRFVNEAKLAAKIRSEHVCRVTDVGMLLNGAPYIAMEYLEGRDLDSIVAAGRTPIEVAVDYVLQAMDAVAQAHARGIVHRDLKPANLFLASDPDREHPIIKVLDFGISKGDLGSDTNVTSSRAILGSPSYMSPEQIKNARTVDSRTDIWSLGVILYELVTARTPFEGETVGEVFASILEAAPRPMKDVAPGIPEKFELIVRRCLERDRDRRYATVAELADALESFASPLGTPLVARIRRSLERSDARASDPDIKAREAGARNRRDERTVASTATRTRGSRARTRVLIALTITGAAGGVYFLAPDRLPFLTRGDASSAADASAQIAAPTFAGIVDAIATAISSLGGDAGGDAADDGVAPPAAKDAGRKPGRAPPKGKPTRRP